MRFLLKIESWLFNHGRSPLYSYFCRKLRYYLMYKRIEKCCTDYIISREITQGALDTERPYWVK